MTTDLSDKIMPRRVTEIRVGMFARRITAAGQMSGALTSQWGHALRDEHVMQRGMRGYFKVGSLHLAGLPTGERTERVLVTEKELGIEQSHIKKNTEPSTKLTCINKTCIDIITKAHPAPTPIPRHSLYKRL
ncbi:hypothetical protein C0Q70_10381 [Pomacea canaliculata]|uniref:Uncharacterized protein n=1 Tax=Pomacea canaliculata TaxID=400727 RepID=A0A2T7PCF2_POMCA|nr:hypothetical protein C0Q70_10381 [Pomacea canaliculata]